MKSKRIFFFALILLICFASYKIVFNKLEYIEVKNYFLSNETKLNELSLELFNQNKIRSISHNKPKHCFPFGFISDNRNVYYIRLFNGELFSVVVIDSFNTEQEFWSQGVQNIYEFYSGERLDKILNRFDISDTLLLSVINKLDSAYLYSAEIEILDSDKQYKFFIELNEGLQRDFKGDVKESDSKTFVRKKINENWFYLYEKRY